MKDLFKQPSTWRGLGIIAGSVFGGFNPELLSEIVLSLGAFLGAIEVSRKERA